MHQDHTIEETFMGNDISLLVVLFYTFVDVTSNYGNISNFLSWDDTTVLYYDIYQEYFLKNTIYAYHDDILSFSCDATRLLKVFFACVREEETKNTPKSPSASEKRGKSSVKLGTSAVYTHVWTNELMSPLPCSQ